MARRPVRCVVALAALVVAAAACGGPKKDGFIGNSSGGPPAPRAATKDAGVIGADAGIPADYETSFAKLTATRIVSSGHATGRWDIDVLASALAKEPLATGHGEVPAGAKVIAVHYERAGGGGRGPLMMMEKREKGYDPDHGDWRYVVVASSGEVVKDGPIEACAGCHDDAPHDHLFKVLVP
jgi:hypothetical protein